MQKYSKNEFENSFSAEINLWELIMQFMQINLPMLPH